MNRRQWMKLAVGAGSAVMSLQENLLVPASAKSVAIAAERRRVPSILLYTGWATHNIGDIGHTPGTLRYLSEHLPEVPVSCWIQKSNPAVLAMLQKRFPKVTLVSGSLDGAGKASTPELQKAFDDAGLVILNSGMLVTRFWRPPTGLMRTCVAHKKPFGMYGQSFDGFRDEDADTVPGLLSQAAFIFCRDTESLQFLRGTGTVNPPVLEFGPDGCFGIDVRDDATAKSFLQQHGLEPRKFLTVTIRTDKEVSANSNNDKYVPPGSAVLTPEEWAEKLRAIIVAWVEKTGNKVALVPEVEKEIWAAKALLLEKLPENIRAKVVHRDHFWNVDEAASLYARAHTVLSVEPHSCIIALANGTPAIHFFSRRHGYKAWMFRDIGLSEWLIDIDNEPAERVIETLDRITANYDLAQSKTHRAMRFVNDRSAEMMSDVRRAIA